MRRLEHLQVRVLSPSLWGVFGLKTDRAAELKKLCVGLDDAAKTTTAQIIDEIIFLENQLTELKKYPFITINPKNPSQQRPTAAAKQYKEFLQQYANCVKILLSVLGKSDSEETSPLREYLNKLKGGEK